jgi:hypothetical protein
VRSATLDTNEYISALQYGGAGARLLGMARAGMIRIDVSDAIVDELVGVLRDKSGGMDTGCMARGRRLLASRIA